MCRHVVQIELNITQMARNAHQLLESLINIQVSSRSVLLSQTPQQQKELVKKLLSQAILLVGAPRESYMLPSADLQTTISQISKERMAFGLGYSYS